MTTYVLKLAKGGETAICFGQAKIALGPGTGAAAAAHGDKPGRAGPARWARASPVPHVTQQFQEMSVFQFPPTSPFFTSNTAELSPVWLCHFANYCQAAQRC